MQQPKIYQCCICGVLSTDNKVDIMVRSPLGGVICKDCVTAAVGEIANIERKKGTTVIEICR